MHISNSVWMRILRNISNYLDCKDYYYYYFCHSSENVLTRVLPRNLDSFDTVCGRCCTALHCSIAHPNYDKLNDEDCQCSLLSTGYNLTMCVGGAIVWPPVEQMIVAVVVLWWSWPAACRNVLESTLCNIIILKINFAPSIQVIEN